MGVQSKESYISFASVGGSYVNLKNLDLSPWGIRAGLVEDSETESFFRSNSVKEEDERNWKLIKDASQGSVGGISKHGDWDLMNLLWPIDLNNPPTESDYFESIEAIRVIHPSEIYIQDIFTAQYFNEKGIFINGYITYKSFHWFKYHNPRDHYFQYPKEYLKETNEFLEFYKTNYKKREYISNAIRYYSDSFNVNSIEMAFICLCICLETIVPGKEQLSYRFKRNLAVLCSESNEKGKRIFSKANLLYGYRSRLIHAGFNSKDFKKFDLFFEYAQILASRMIIEMLLHSIQTIEELDAKITELGFGQGKTISENYKDFKGNILTWDKVSEYEFDK